MMSPFNCDTCDGPVVVELCSTWNDTDHPWAIGMECGCCGQRWLMQCRGCSRLASQAAHPSAREP